MNLKLVSGDYKSIKSLDWEDIPEFVVVTGKNGSGKTQLLELIHHHLGLDPNSKNKAARDKNNPFYGVKLEAEHCDMSYEDVIYQPATWTLGNLGGVNASTFSGTINNLHQHIIGAKTNPAYTELADIVTALIGKPSGEVRLQDVQTNLPIDHFDYINRIQLHEGLSEHFLAYHLRSAEMRDQGKSNERIESELGTAPWEVINGLLDDASFPYEVSKPVGFLGDFQFRLIGRGAEALDIDFSDLSSGEKILISMAIWMFNTGKDKRLPKLLLMDEPDAHLHPSGIRDFINVLETVLVGKHGVRVIMSTHSPTTVSFSPDYALFEMSKSAPQIKPLPSKDYGINLLTDGLITVKRNMKYVLVEDEDDAKFYSAVFSILQSSGHVNSDIGIIFIPASNKEANTSGGASVVKTWVDKFVSEGVLGIFQGLIDRDVGSEASQNIYVINRYSMENYLLDPILVFSSLLHTELSFGIPGISLTHKDEHKVRDSSVEDLQKVADYILSEIRPLLSGLPDDADEIEKITFINGVTLEYPRWFLQKRGHDLYVKFQYKYKKAINLDELIKALIRQEFIPEDLVAMLLEIQKAT